MFVTIALMSEPPPEEERSVSRQPITLQVQPRWIAPIALALALIAIGIAVWALVAVPKSASAKPTGQQTADAKNRACTAYTTVRKAVVLQTHSDLGTGPVEVATVAANARLAMSSGGSYLLARLDPATPDDLATAIRSFASDLQDISMYAQAGLGSNDPAQAGRLRDGETDSGRVAGLCK
jgi:hypothetical protein